WTRTDLDTPPLPGASTLTPPDTPPNPRPPNNPKSLKSAALSQRTDCRAGIGCHFVRGRDPGQSPDAPHPGVAAWSRPDRDSFPADDHMHAVSGAPDHYLATHCSRGNEGSATARRSGSISPA